MNYDTMEVGPELDALVATQVMGWRRDECSRYMAGDHFQVWVPDWSPSADIAQAWHLVERLKELGHGVEVLDNPGHIRVRVNYGESASVLAPTVPLAICRAALKSTHKES